NSPPRFILDLLSHSCPSCAHPVSATWTAGGATGPERRGATGPERRGGYRLSAGVLPALPARLPLAEEGADALLGVFGPESVREALLLGLDALVEIAGVRDRLDLLDRDGRLPGQTASPGDGGVEELVVGHDPVDEAGLEGIA